MLNLKTGSKKMIVNHNSLNLLWKNLCLPDPDSGLMLFGIRGALPIRWKAVWKKSWALKAVKVDYKHFRCSLGIWNIVEKKILLVPASTVPHYSQVMLAAQKGGEGANQLEWGYYSDFSKGEHLQGKLRGHAALRQTSSRLIRRSSTRPPYGIQDKLYFSNPYDNLHCGWNRDWKSEGFSSAGCLVVAGWPYCPRSPHLGDLEGPWKMFQQELYQCNQQNFSLLLVEAGKFKKLISNNPPGNLLCFGSSGEAVRALQKNLREKGVYSGPLHGKLDSRTYKAWNKSGFKL